MANKPVDEEVEQVDELSKKTLGSYVKKASGAERPKNPMNPKSVPITTIAAYQGDSETGHFGKRFNQATYDKAERLRKNRETGIKRAVDKLTKEEVDYLEKDLKKRKVNNDKAIKDMKKMGSPTRNPHFGEEVEQIDETAKIVAHLQKRYGDNIRKSHVRSAANDFGVGYTGLAHAVRKKLGVIRLKEEQIDEATYFVHTANNAHHVNKKIPTGKKDAMGQALMTSKIVKSFPYGDTQSKQTSPDQHKAAHAHAKKLNAGMKNEEVEQVDEISKAMAGRYVQKAAASIDLTAWRQGYKEAGAGNPSKQLEKKLSKRHKGIETAVKKLTKEEIINRAIDKYMPELETYVPMTQEEKLVAKLEHLPEAHVLMLLGLYETLNENNRNKMMNAIDTPEGINSLIDFAIQNRGG
jgi:hypothetical protein